MFCVSHFNISSPCITLIYLYTYIPRENFVFVNVFKRDKLFKNNCCLVGELENKNYLNFNITQLENIGNNILLLNC